MVILTVTMNPAYDMTYRVERFERGRAHRVYAVEQRIGGKGVNVTRVLNQLGTYARATGFSDHAFAAAAELEMPVDFVHALPWVRRTVVVSECEDGTATSLQEPGARVTDPHASEQLAVRVAGLLPDIAGLVISGPLPGGIDPALPAEIARTAIGDNVPTICDIEGEALRLAARVPDVVLMPSQAELQRLTSARPDTIEAVVAAAAPLVERGVRAVITAPGLDGMAVVTAEGMWSATLAEPVAGASTGAEDAAVAAVIAALSTTSSPDWPAVLGDAVATAAAAVVVPVAGEIDRGLRARLAPTVRLARLDLSKSP
ncbi:hexose kinase [Nocardia sp. CNY236]|uniref:hexose kinase n=1 Tax=Nocardia sp. CNY236 TaxID=1169152 RepID=UPI00041ABD6A|nr:hexose kinase [Nocardia sp. CNY236]